MCNVQSACIICVICGASVCALTLASDYEACILVHTARVCIFAYIIDLSV